MTPASTARIKKNSMNIVNPTSADERMTASAKHTAPSSMSQAALDASWKKVAPFWPLENLIAVNPLQGFEDLQIEQALCEGARFFQRADLPVPMQAVNRETIKWCQAFFDEGQATIAMPGRERGLFSAWRSLAVWDTRLTQNNRQTQQWLADLPTTPQQVIAECLLKLSIPREDHALFLTLTLTTLPGWAAHIKYRTEWTGAQPIHPHPVTQADYTAMRLVITCLLWPEASNLLKWHTNGEDKSPYAKSVMARMNNAETAYRMPLLKTLSDPQNMTATQTETPKAQLVFCIDVRSEPFRRALEATGAYDTYGFAGFFGVFARIEDSVSGDSYASCPVLLSPRHTVIEGPACSAEGCRKDHTAYHNISLIKRLYQSVKYNFSTPFALVESMGALTGAWMSIRSLSPALAARMKGTVANALRPQQPRGVDISTISFSDQCAYAEGALKMMGLTRDFAPLVVLCGHGSTTENNAFATALDCGACGGRHGASNARILAAILNNPQVRSYIAGKGIHIPAATVFIAAEHNTTTDQVDLYDHAIDDADTRAKIQALKNDLSRAKHTNALWRGSEMNIAANNNAHPDTAVMKRSLDWAQVRPEWGLARNAAFIVAPRVMTRSVNLDGRSFLHSYDWTQDPDGSSLTVILTAPMVVAQWINTQYMFSTLDNVAYGAGSKVTTNITGKIGVMQGNASDLMHGLPMQSVNSRDNASYHVPMRLMTVVYAPRGMIDRIIAQQDVLKKLFGNGWVTLACIDPVTQKAYLLERDLSWSAPD